MVKKIVSILLAMLIILTAVFILGLGICQVVKGLYNVIYVYAIQNNFRLKEYHMSNCQYHMEIVLFGDFWGREYGYDHSWLAWDNIAGATVLKAPILCLIANAIRNIASICTKFVVASLFFVIALRLFSLGDGKLGKVIKKVSYGLGSACLFGLTLTSLVMGIIKCAVWIRTVISMFTYVIKYGSIGESLYMFTALGSISIYSLLYYVVAIASFIGAIFFIVSIFAKDKKKLTPEEKKELQVKKAEEKKELQKKNAEKKKASLERELAKTEAFLKKANEESIEEPKEETKVEEKTEEKVEEITEEKVEAKA